MAAISPPESTKSPTEISSSAWASMTRSSTPSHPPPHPPPAARHTPPRDASARPRPPPLSLPPFLPPPRQHARRRIDHHLAALDVDLGHHRVGEGQHHRTA